MSMKLFEWQQVLCQYLDGLPSIVAWQSTLLGSENDTFTDIYKKLILFHEITTINALSPNIDHLDVIQGHSRFRDAISLHQIILKFDGNMIEIFISE